MALNKISPATFTTGVLVGDTLNTPGGAHDSIPSMTVSTDGEVVSAALEIQSTKGAFLLSRLTPAQRDDPNFVPDNGMILYNSATNEFNVYMNDAWERIAVGDTGDVNGPNVSVTNNLAIFADDTGKTIADGGISIDDVGDVNGPNVSVINHIPVFSDITGKTLSDSGVNVSQVPPAFLASRRVLVNVNQIGNLGSIQFVNDVGGIYVDALSPVQFITNDFGPESQVCSLFTGELPGSSTTPSALVELQSTTGAFLVSRMTTVQRDALSATPGMILFNTDTNFFDLYQGSSWVNVNTGAGGGDMTGPGSSVDSSIALFSGTSGALLKDSAVLIDSSGNITHIDNASANSIVVGSLTGTPTTTSSALEVQGTTTAFVFSRMTGSERDALDPTNGMTIYDNDTNMLQCYLDGVWTTLAAGGSGDVFGPSESVENNLAIFADTTGKVLSDSGKPLEEVGDVFGPEDALANTIPYFSDTTGKILADSLILWTNVVQTLIPSAIPFNLPQFSDVSGRLISDSGISVASLGNVTGPVSSAAGDIAVFSDTTGKVIADSAVKISQDPSTHNNLFIGVSSGNLSGTGRNNISYGIDVLTDVSGGQDNVGAGFGVMPSLTSGSSNLGAGISSLLSLVDGSNNVSLGNNSSQENISGEQNVSVGVNALQQNLTDGNVALGFEALQNSSGASGLVAVGLQAANANISGDSVTAIGSLCLFNSLASFNTAVGAGAGYVLSTGEQNTILGADALAESDTSSNSVAVGYQSQNKSTVGENTSVGAFSLQNNVIGADCTALGFQTLMANTASGNTALGTVVLTSNTEGILNTGAGATALSQNIDGDKNSAFGAGALQENDSASNCTSMGYNALTAQTTSTPSNNSAFGSESLTSNEIGTGLSAFGALSLSANHDGDFCSAFGYKSQNSGVSANNCTSMGYASLEANTASGNTAVGAGAMLLSETGENCTAVGIGALSSNISGSSCVAIGENALFGNEDGSNTTCVGAASGSSQNSYVNSIFLGALADASHNGLTNAGAIGYNSMISVSNAINLGNGCNIGINQASPAYTLHVSNVSNLAIVGFDNSTGSPAEPASGGGLFVSSNDLKYVNPDGIINLTGPSGVTAGDYTLTNLSVDARGRITAASSSSILGTATEIDVTNVSNTYTISLDLAFTARVDLLETEVTGLIADVALLQTEVEGPGGLIDEMIAVQAELGTLTIGLAAVTAETTALYTQAFVLQAPSITLTAAQNIAALSSTGGILKTIADTPFVSSHIAIAEPVSTSTFTGDYYAPGQPTTLIDTYAASTYNLYVGTHAGSTSGSQVSNTGVGVRCLQSLNNGNFNVGLGHLAGSALLNSASCIAVGYEALFNCQNDSNNIGIGTSALYTVNGASDNIAIGTFSSNLLSTGSSNISIGSSSARNSSTGSNNISIGIESLYSATTATKSVAIGSGALRSVITAVGNIAIGYQAAYNTTSNENIVIGDSAFFNNVGGNQNIIMGASAFTSTTSSAFNTAIGYFAGTLLTTGNSNVFVGHQAGYAAGITSLSDCVFVGQNSGSTVSGITNAVAIGQGCHVSQSNSLILGNGCNVGIGTSSPQASLSVNGGQIVKRTATAISYTVLSTDYLIAVTSTAAARTVTLPTASSNNTGQIYFVKDESGAAATNNITVNVTGGGNIDGASSIAINANYALLMFYSSGSQWFIG